MTQILRKRACGANSEGFLAFVSRRTHATRNGLCSRPATIRTDKTNVIMKALSKSASCAHHYVQLMREYIFSGNV